MAAWPGREDRQGFSRHGVLEIFPRLGERLFHLGSELSGGEQRRFLGVRAERVPFARRWLHSAPR